MKLLAILLVACLDATYSTVKVSGGFLATSQRERRGVDDPRKKKTSATDDVSTDLAEAEEEAEAEAEANAEVALAEKDFEEPSDEKEEPAEKDDKEEKEEKDSEEPSDEKEESVEQEDKEDKDSEEPSDEKEEPAEEDSNATKEEDTVENKVEDKEVLTSYNPPRNTTNDSIPGPAPPAPDSPFAWAYEEADAVARDIEERHGAEFFPEGTHDDLDMGPNVQHKIDSMFSQEPNVFGNCILIRDFAEPLRRSSSLMGNQGAQMLHRRIQNKGGLDPHRHRRHHRRSHLNADAPGTASLVSGRNASLVFGKPKLPDSKLLPKGGTYDHDGNDGELQVEMFAFLRSISGEVPVIPNGEIANWGSKRKVPIAGYLCTGENGPVLHTLSTPCLPTSIGADGEPFPPPPSLAKQLAASPSPSGAAPAAAPAAASSSEAESLEAEAEEAAALAEAEAEGSSPPPAMATAFLDERRQAPPGIQPPDFTYHVWVGSQRLTFDSKPKGDKFCKRLAEKISRDLGDTEWDTDLEQLKQELVGTNPNVTAFAQIARKATSEWTTGKKSVVVVVMDWMTGDKSGLPLSQQTLTPEHYRDKVFPRVRKAFREMSYGAFEIDVTVVPKVIQYTRPRSRYMAEGYPFPGLYNGAKQSLASNAEFGATYNFDKFDLAYVISPQQKPTGTKGVAYVGAKAAMCNGCEAISENFQVMVAVHELGHNLGLSHASSNALEYGNVYEWMGNYPDVQGLSYGLGYKLFLKWLPASSVPRITNDDLPSLNNEYIIKPYDSTAKPKAGEIVGIRFHLNEHQQDLYVSYRETAGVHAGIYLVWQDRQKPKSKLIDTTCNSPSQQDARLQTGWTYIDPAQKVVITVTAVTKEAATVRVYSAPDQAGIAAIRARKTFSDGQWKCPRVCSDSDLLVSQYNGCSGLAKDGYCDTGSITMSGKKYTIKGDLCPKSCDACDEVMQASDSSDACADRNIKISSMTCSQAAAQGYCDASTNIGNVGDDLCPKSCGKCPPKPPAGGSSGTFTDPKPSKTIGTSSAEESAPPIPPGDGFESEAEADEDKEDAADAAPPPAAAACEDDPAWLDSDGDGCSIYAKAVSTGEMTVEDACAYNNGAAKKACRATCKICGTTASEEAAPGICEDSDCVTHWQKLSGKCFVCSDWPGFCKLDDSFREDCPRTCKTCEGPEKINATSPVKLFKAMFKAQTTTTTTTTEPLETPPEVCEDKECVEGTGWKGMQCFKCADYAADFCGRDADFTRSCLKTCKMCDPSANVTEPPCADSFKPRTCRRYRSWGWCGMKKIAKHCQSSCGLCESGEQSRATRRSEVTLIGVMIAVALTSLVSH